MSDSRAYLFIAIALLAQIITGFVCASQIVNENYRYTQSTNTLNKLQDLVMNLENQYSQLTSLTRLHEFVDPTTQQPITRQIDLSIPNP